MSREQPSWGAGWSAGLRVWVESGGQALLGKGRLELLEGIDRWRSISAAARQMGMSYRRAWDLVQGINSAAGEPLVAAAPGGPQGGGAHLTPLGRWAVDVFRDLQEHLRRTAIHHLARLVQGPQSPEIHVAAAVSLEEVLGQLLADYALLQPAVRVRTVFGASDELAEHLLAGAPGDLFLTADPGLLDRLEAAQLLGPCPAVPLAGNGLAAIGPAEHGAPVRKAGDLARAGVRIALAEPGCPLGRYTRAYLEELGLYPRLASHAVRVDNSRSVVAAVRAGRVDAGLVYGSDAARANGCRLLFRARRQRVPVRYSAVLLARGQHADAPRALLEFLTSPAATKRFRVCGFLPARRAMVDADSRKIDR